MAGLVWGGQQRYSDVGGGAFLVCNFLRFHCHLTPPWWLNSAVVRMLPILQAILASMLVMYIVYIVVVLIIEMAAPEEN